MKKKLLLIAIPMIISSLGFAEKEVNFKVGYDGFRVNTGIDFKNPERVVDGFTIDAELLPFSIGDGRFKAGIGIEHDFGRTTPNMTTFDGKKVVGNSTPVYIVGKTSLIKIKDSNNTTYSPLYLTNRVGWSFNVGEDPSTNKTYVVDSTYKSGPYAAIGLGGEYKYFVGEALYSVNYMPQNSDNALGGRLNHRLGVSLGIRFGWDGEQNHIAEQPVKKAPIKKVDAPVETITVKPEPKKVIVSENVEGSDRVFFANNKYKLSQPELARLDSIRGNINSLESADIDLIGNTSSPGSALYNKQLGMKRALFVKQKLIQDGLHEGIKINNVISNGESKPIDDNKTKEGRRNNRNVEIKYKGWATHEEIEE